MNFIKFTKIIIISKYYNKFEIPLYLLKSPKY